MIDCTKKGVVGSSGSDGFDYLGSLTYTSNSLGLQLESAAFGDGVIRVTGTSQEINYFLTDHLGSVRVIVDKNGAVKERNDYYAFGAKHIRGDYPQSDNRYDYNGKEEQTTGDLKFLDYGARMYDGALGRWFCVDPLAEERLDVTPFAFCSNIPISRIDPNGMLDDFFQNDNGDVTWKPITDKSYTDSDGAIWKNIGTSYFSSKSDGGGFFSYQYLEDGKLMFASSSITKNEMKIFSMFHSLDAMKAAMRYHVDPSWSNYQRMVKLEIEAQYNDLSLVAGSLSMGGVGMKALGKVAAKGGIQLSVKAFGHTFKNHGKDATNFLINRAKGSGAAQGQFLDNQKAAEFIINNLNKTANGAVNIPLPNGFPARVIMPNGAFKPATHIRIVPSGSGVKTAYPLIP